MKFTCTATMPVIPDPAVTPKTKQVAKQFFAASVAGVEVVPETEIPMTETAALPFEIDEDTDFELTGIHEDASGLRAVKKQTGKSPTQPDTIPPDVPGDFGGITFTPVAEEVKDPATETEAEAGTETAETTEGSTDAAADAGTADAAATDATGGTEATTEEKTE